MPILYKQIQGEVFTEKIGSVSFFKSIEGEIQGEDYINLNGFVAYLQNFTKIDYTAALIKPNLFGLTNNNIPIITLNISY